MYLHRLVVLLLLCTTALVFPASVSARTYDRPGTIPATIALEDGSACVLDGEECEFILGDFIFVREPWCSTQLLPIWARVPVGAVRPGDPILIEGTKWTVGGQPVIIASRIRLYLDSMGRVWPFSPKNPLIDYPWDYFLDVPVTPLSPPIAVVPDPVAPVVDSAPMVGEPGTVAAAKLNAIAGRETRSQAFQMFDDDDLPLQGVVVTSVFRTPGTNRIQALYVQQPSVPSGIRVEPEAGFWPWVDVGDQVTVDGDVVDGGTTGECHIVGTVVKTSTTGLPNPLGLTNLSTAGGAFGLQPALYARSDAQNTVGSGLTAVGALVKVWGKLLEADEDETNDRAIYYIDDGSGLARSDHDGLKVVYYRAADAPAADTGDMISAAGILGAELDGDCPVPVVLVPRQPAQHVVYVRSDGDDTANGLTWSTAKSTIQAAIDTAAASSPKCEVWVSAGSYFPGEIDMQPGVNLYGGFSGGETEREQRNWRINRSAIVCAAPIYTPTGSGDPVTIDGFFIKPIGIAGGLQCVAPGCDVAIRHNTFASGGRYQVFVDSNGGHGVRIEDNWFKDATTAVYCVSADTSVVVANNTIVGGTTGIGLYSASPIIANNIIAFNFSGIDADYTYIPSNPAILNNCLYGNYGNYSPWIIPPAGNNNIEDDPEFVNYPDDIHILPTSPCRDAGYNDAVPAVALDIDGRSRIVGDTVDIGADETAEHDLETMTFSADRIVAPSTSTTLTATLADLAADPDSPLSGRRVDFTLSAGQITAINGQPASGTSGYGTTDSNGQVTLTLTTPSGNRQTAVTATTSLPLGRVTQTCHIFPHQYKVGFLYDFCDEYRKGVIDDYLSRIESGHIEVDYQTMTLTDLTSGALSSYNVVFIVLPNDTLTPAQTTALNTFVTASGREKRVVLVGEWNDWFRESNAYLNDIAEQIGMGARFSTGVNGYDVLSPLDRLCPVNPANYLAAGVVSLWDGHTDKFADGWDSYARPISYVWDLLHPEPPTQPESCPWIIEEDTQTNGSRVAIHDTDLFEACNNDTIDLVPDRNFRFVYNLCTLFPIN